MMKTLYESILDNEESIINKSIKHVKNPFVKIKNILLQNNNIQYIKSIIEQIIKNEIDFQKDFKGFEVGIGGIDSIINTTIYYYLPVNNKKPYMDPDILTIRLYDNPKYGPFSNIDIPENDLMICFPDPNNQTENKFIKNKLGFKDIFEYKRWLIYFVKRYELKPSKDKYTYYI